MPFSHRIKWLIIMSFIVIVLAYAANEGMNSQTPDGGTQRGVPYPFYPRDIDPGAIDSTPRKTTPAGLPVIKTPVAPARPVVSAEAYLVANLETGEVYAERNSRAVFPIASLSKLLTALVAVHTLSPDQKITITQPMLDAYGDAGHLTLGETYTVAELLKPMLLESSNDAAEAFAQSYGYEAFIEKMNSLAQEIGMTSTSYKDASGLNPGNISNAQDLLKLAQYLYHNEQPLLDLTRQISQSVATTTEHGSHIWNSINPFQYDPHFIGGKTGRTTEAKESMVSMFRYESKGVSYPVAVIVLRSDFGVREVDSSWLFEQFTQKVDKK